MKKKLLAVLLCTLMSVQVFGTAAFAEEGQPVFPETETKAEITEGTGWKEDEKTKEELIEDIEAEAAVENELPEAEKALTEENEPEEETFTQEEEISEEGLLMEKTASAALQEMEVRQSGSATAQLFESVMDAENRTIWVRVPEDKRTVAFKPALAEDAEVTGMSLSYVSIKGTQESVELTNGAFTAISKAAVLPVDYGNGTNAMTLTITAGELAETWTIQLVRESILSALAVKDPGMTGLAISPAFKAATAEYTVEVPDDVDYVYVLPTPRDYNTYGSKAYVNGNAVDEDGSCRLSLTGEETQAVITCTDGTTLSFAYTLTVVKKAHVTLSFVTEPASAAVSVTSPSGRHVNSVDGSFTGLPGKYTYTVTCPGYVGISGEVTIESGEQVIPVELVMAPASEELKELEAEWANFRGSDDNAGVSDARTPIDKDTVYTVWERKIGNAVSTFSIGQCIIVGGRLYGSTGTQLVVADKRTGELINSTNLSCGNNGGYMPMVYGDGMLFVPGSGAIQCFNAETLQSLWMYTDSVKGSVYMDMRYENGFLYAGFFSGKTDKNFVCLNVTDEDPENDLEAKVPTWTRLGNGGYQWTGSYTNDEYVFVTGSGTSTSWNTPTELLTLDKATGNMVQVHMVDGAMKCAPVFYNNRLYVSTYTGYIYSFNLDENGRIDDTRPIEPCFIGGQITSTPAIFNNRLYVGGAKATVGVFPDAGIRVVDINPETGEMNLAYIVPTIGNAQTSGLISTGYFEETGYVYVYFAVNVGQGTVYMVKDKPGMTEPAPESGIFFTPSVPQYCINSLICDKDGVLYYRNDSATLFAISALHADLVLAQAEGGNAVMDDGIPFDGTKAAHVITVDTGTKNLKLTLVPSNGAEVWIGEVSGMEQNVLLDGTEKTLEVKVINDTVSRTYSFTIQFAGNPYDVNGDGEVDIFDAMAIVDAVNSSESGYDAKYDVNRDGEVDIFDAMAIVELVNGEN